MRVQVKIEQTEAFLFHQNICQHLVSIMCIISNIGYRAHGKAKLLHIPECNDCFPEE